MALPVNQSGLLYHIVPYGVDENGYIDYDALRDLAKKEKPKMIIAGCLGLSARDRLCQVCGDRAMK